MKWVEWGRHSYVLGPNLRKEFINKVPTALNVNGQDNILQNGSGCLVPECVHQLGVHEPGSKFRGRILKSHSHHCSETFPVRVLKCGSECDHGKSDHGSPERSTL